MSILTLTFCLFVTKSLNSKIKTKNAKIQIKVQKFIKKYILKEQDAILHFNLSFYFLILNI